MPFEATQCCSFARPGLKLHGALSIRFFADIKGEEQMAAAEGMDGTYYAGFAYTTDAPPNKKYIREGHPFAVHTVKPTQPQCEPAPCPFAWLSSRIALRTFEASSGVIFCMLCAVFACSPAFFITSSSELPRISKSQPGLMSPHRRTFS